MPNLKNSLLPVPEVESISKGIEEYALKGLPFVVRKCKDMAKVASPEQIKAKVSISLRLPGPSFAYLCSPSLFQCEKSSEVKLFGYDSQGDVAYMFADKAYQEWEKGPFDCFVPGLRLFPTASSFSCSSGSLDLRILDSPFDVVELPKVCTLSFAFCSLVDLSCSVSSFSCSASLMHTPKPNGHQIWVNRLCFPTPTLILISMLIPQSLEAVGNMLPVCPVGFLLRVAHTHPFFSFFFLLFFVLRG
jgi:hypothetical protein